MQRSLSVLSVLVVLAAAPVGAQAPFTQTLPAGLDNVDGSSSTAWPWGVAATHLWHWIYDSSNFASQTPIIISQIAVRPNANGTIVAGSFQNVEITMCSATVDFSVPTSTSAFAPNMDADAAVVFNGTVTFPASAGAPVGPWVNIPLSNPFLFNPGIGKDFIIQVRTPGPGNYVAMSSVDGHFNGMGVRYGNTSNAFATNANSGNTGVAGFVPTVRIDYAPATGYVLDAQTTGGGVGDLTLIGVFSSSYPAATQGFTLISFTPSVPTGSGPLAGIIPDSVTWPIFDVPAAVGNPLHYLNSPGFYPDAPFVVPAGALTSLAGIKADFVQVGFDANLSYVFKSNVDSVTF
jgi:hypothetical protein